MSLLVLLCGEGIDEALVSFERFERVDMDESLVSFERFGRVDTDEVEDVVRA